MSIKTKNLFLILGLIQITFSCINNNDKNYKKFDIKKIQINENQIDTLIFADSWRNNNYVELDSDDSINFKKIFFFKTNKIKINQTYFKNKDNFGNLFIEINSKKININNLYYNEYGINLDDQLYIMENLVTAKKTKNQTQIDLVLVENNCLGEFCNDVEIITLNFINNLFVGCDIHDENFNNYNL